jgi:hypothetical protein
LFQKVREWWNQNGNNYTTASSHLFQRLGVDASNHLPQKVGSGQVTILRQDPKELAMQTQGAKILRNLVRHSVKTDEKQIWREKNWLHLQRGEYDVAAVMDESVSDSAYTVTGPLIDLYDPQLPVLAKKRIAPGQTSLLLNLSRLANKSARVLAAASRCYDVKSSAHEFSCLLKGPSDTNGIARIFLPAKAKKVTVLKSNQVVECEQVWDDFSCTLKITYVNEPDGVRLKVTF